MESNQSRSYFQVGSRGMRTEASVPLKELRGKYLLCDDSEMVTKKDKEFVTPSIPHDILFAIGGFRGGTPSDVIEAYDARAYQWSVVSSTHFYSYFALLNEASEKNYFSTLLLIYTK
jgi:hypothetical protein